MSAKMAKARFPKTEGVRKKMLEPVKPPEEELRLQELCGLGILDTPQEDRFDRITRTACRVFSVPIALISLVDSERQWFKSRQGLDVAETERRISFCGHAILQEEAFVINDASLDSRFTDNPLVEGDFHLRFYAGYPLHGPRGHKIGTLCLIDKQARSFSAEDVQTLADLAAWAENELSSSTLAEAMEKLTRSEKRWRQSQKLLQAVMDGTSAYVHLRDLNGHYLYVNREYEKIFHCSQQDLLGKKLDDVFPPELAALYGGYERQVIETGSVLQTETQVQFPDGIHTYLVVRSPLLDENGQIYGACGVGTDITEDKRLVSELSRLNQKLFETSSLHQAILDSSNFSIISTDVDGIIRTFNRGAERMLGYCAAELVGLQSPALLHDGAEIVNRAIQLQKELGRVVEPGFEVFVAKAKLGQADEHEWTYLRKDGSRLPVMLSVTALHDAQGQVNGYLGIAYDLTERKRIENMKNEFISTVSHELRTPLTSIRGSIGLLSAGAVGEIPTRARTLLDIAKTNCDRLARLINDILDIEKIESGNMRFVNAVHALQPMLEAALGATQSYAAQYNVYFELDAGSESLYVNVDPDRLAQVLVNLLSNATKFSPQEGKVILRAKRLGTRVRVSVIDHGEGIAPEFHDRIFRRFAQADSTDSRSKGGTGLGLSISKAIIERMHGLMGFNSVPGKGSEFYFDLPLMALGGEHSQHRRCVLICESDQQSATLITQLLTQAGLDSEVVLTTGQAKQKLESAHYDALTLDLGLADDDGMSLLAWMRQQNGALAHLANLPVVVISVSADDLSQIKGRAFGVFEWIRKPVDTRYLVQAIGMALTQNVHNKPHILHIEDDDDLSRIIATMLQPNYHVCHAAHMNEAKNLLQSQKFDLILLDLDLPDGNGAELLGALSSANVSTPVVIFSAREAAVDVSAQVRAALVKSQTSNDQLLATIDRLIAARSEIVHETEPV